MKKLIILIVLIAGFGAAKAQQIEQWTQFALNEYTVNPAVAGSEEYFHASTMFRQQWAGVTDAPRTYYLSIHGPVWGDRMGIGGSLINDVVGPLSRAGLQLNYAYHLKLTEDYKLSFTLATSVLRWTFNGAEMNLENAEDIALSSQAMNAWVPDFGFGTRFSTKNFHVGIYIPQLTNSKLKLFSDYDSTLSAMNRQYNLNLGYKHSFGDNFTLDANFYSRYVQSIFMQELMVRGIIKDAVWIGLSGRLPISGNAITAVGILVGYQFANNMQIGYSYDYDVRGKNSMLGAASVGSHEVMLGIRFSKKNQKPIIPASEL